MTYVATLIRHRAIEAPDVLCGGTPCQAFSVAGLRQSLGDSRGNLSLIFCDIANAIDEQRTTPCIVKWENVPGVLSTKDNAFGCFLAGLAGEDDPLEPPGKKWANAGVVHGPRRVVAWRTLDAQYFGLAQRRKRVFVVASARDDFDPAEVLFEFDGVRRDTAPRRETGEAVAGTLAASVGGSDENNRLTVTHALRGEGFDASEDGTGRGTPIVPVLAFGGNNTSGPITAAAALNAKGGSGRMDSESETMLVAFNSNAQTDQMAFDPHLSAPLTCSQSSQLGVRVSDVHATLDANNGSRRHNGAVQGMRVRRLMPIECERLQGFPDNHTNIPKAKDGPRYKALGNSWAVPCVRWIGRRIEAQLQ